MRNLPWDIPSSLLLDSLGAALAGSDRLLEPPTIVELPGGPTKHIKDNRMKLHEGRAALRFADAAAADAFCASMEGGKVLPGCGDRPLFIADPPQCPPPCDPSQPRPRRKADMRPQWRFRRAPRTERDEAVDAALLSLSPPAELLPARGAASEADWLDGCHWRLSEEARASASAGMAWESMPAECDPQRSAKKMADGSLRGARKREQVTEFACVLELLLRDAREGGTVVDAGCGSGNLLLPLAFKFPGFHFLGLDFKPAAVTLVRKRAAVAGLTNVSALAADIDAFDPFRDCSGEAGDSGVAAEALVAVLALHACGGASDAAIRLAARASVPFAISPCCIGKVNMALAPWEVGLEAVDLGDARGGAKSLWLAAQLAATVGGLGVFAALAAAADRNSVDHGSGAPADERTIRRTRRAKTVVELDRLMASAEAIASNDAAALPASRPARGMGRLVRMGGSSMDQYTQSYTDLLVSPTPALLACLVPASNGAPGAA